METRLFWGKDESEVLSRSWLWFFVRGLEVICQRQASTEQDC